MIRRLRTRIRNYIVEVAAVALRRATAEHKVHVFDDDVFLVLEATIGFNKRDESDQDGDEELLSEPQEIETNGKVRFTTQDHRFLKALRITVDEEV